MLNLIKKKEYREEQRNYIKNRLQTREKSTNEIMKLNIVIEGETMDIKKMRLGDLLVDAGKITEEQLKDALKKQKTSKKKLGEVLVDDNYVTETDIIEVLEFQLGIPHIDLRRYNVDRNAVMLITENLARKYTLIPVKKRDGSLFVAMADPLNIFAVDDVKITTGMDVEIAISPKKQILDLIDIFFNSQDTSSTLDELLQQSMEDSNEDIDQETLNEINNAPVVKLVNSIIRQAVKSKASDIHIEPFEEYIRIRIRVDGELQEIMNPPKHTHSAIVTRIKIMGKMNIAEKRVPQDGRVELKIDNSEVDLRISVLPTVLGEKIVIRLLNRETFLLSKEKLGFIKENLDTFNNLIKNPSGIILVTGPTGSGKTTTLYTVLRELNIINKNIITVEDPVEYKIHGINQVQVNNKAGLTFASGLRSILRQDPDIVMIGEIRDAETAQIAVRAAITGHLVISTVHTNDAPSTVTRLIDMGIEPYLISSSVVGIVAQRLVKKICENCKSEYNPDSSERDLLNIDSNITLYKGKGCNQCYDTGYRGRIGIHEIMDVDKEIKLLIDNRSGINNLRNKSIENGMITLRENCKRLVLNGITTVDELVKVTYNME